MVRVSVESGEIVETTSMADVQAANPNLHIWNLQAITLEDPRHKKLKIEGVMVHGNEGNNW